MADFKFNIEDMFDSDRMMKSTVAQINKNIPEGLTNLTTTRHKDKSRNPLGVTMFTLSEILMKAPAMRSPEDLLNHFESVVSGTLGSMYDEIKGIPGIGQLTNLIPADIRAVVDGLNPDSTGKEDKDNPDAADTGSTTAGTGDTGTGDARAVISIARSLIGVTESPPGSNKTKIHTEMGVGSMLWCALFLRYIFKKAGIEQKQITNACQATADNYKAINRFDPSTPKVGALVFFQYSRNNHLNHIALCIGFDDTHITTIEGNTSSSNKGDQSNGGGVFEKKHARSAQYVRGYAYPIYPEPPAPPAATTTTTTAPSRVQ